MEKDVKAQVSRIGASPFFCKSKRLCRFLNFAANQALSGQVLKETDVGIHVFDRGSDFDPRIDPIVRVEARRLRSKLKEYYALFGRDEQLMIDFPKGTYNPVFRFRTVRTKKSKHPTQFAVAILPFATLTPSILDEALAAGLREELIHQLVQFPNLRVHAEFQESNGDGNPGRSGKVTTWKVFGSIRSMRGISRITVQLINTASNAYIWSEQYDRAIGDILDVQDRVAKAVVTRLKATLALSEPERPNSAEAVLKASA
jgi:serine/threonine-protein kinase